ncbi:unnamed protein product, partial [Heterosigma akashiwo]
WWKWLRTLGVTSTGRSGSASRTSPTWPCTGACSPKRSPTWPSAPAGAPPSAPTA